jgi:outer membrane lipopolysaccharide assembly protein LptE/RlpB
MAASCGFHLRGSTPKTDSALSHLYLSASEASAVANELRLQLGTAGTTLVGDRDLAQYRLRLDDYNIEQTVLSVSAITGKAEEYQLQLTVRMTVMDQENSPVIDNQLIRISRDYAFDDTAVLGSVTERDELITEMTKLAATQIIQVLNTLND